MRRFVISKHLLIATGVVALFTAAPTTAHAAPVPLGAADPTQWAVLSLGGTLKITAHSGVFGNVGVGDGAGIDMLMNKGFVQGDVYFVGDSTNMTNDADSYVGPTAASGTGGTFNTANPDIHFNSALAAAAVADAISFSATYGALPDSAGVTCSACSGGSINLANTSGVITVTGSGQHVLNITNLSLSSSTLTINGPADAYLIINISGNISVQNSNILIPTMGDLGVLYNVKNDAVASDIDFHSSPNVIHGILLGADEGAVTIHDGTCVVDGGPLEQDCTQWYGSAFAALSDYDFEIKSGTTIFGPVTTTSTTSTTTTSGGGTSGQTVPEPGTMALFGAGLMIAAQRLRSRKRR